LLNAYTGVNLMRQFAGLQDQLLNAAEFPPLGNGTLGSVAMAALLVLLTLRPLENPGSCWGARSIALFALTVFPALAHDPGLDAHLCARIPSFWRATMAAF
jgi:hypothetical protein